MILLNKFLKFYSHLPGPLSIIEQKAQRVTSSTKFSSSKSGSSLTSSHPMISNQLAATTAIPLIISPSTVTTVANTSESINHLTQMAAAHTKSSKMIPSTVLALTSMQNQVRAGDSGKKQSTAAQPFLFNPISTNHILNTIPPRSHIILNDVSPSNLTSKQGLSVFTSASEVAGDNRLKGPGGLLNPLHMNKSSSVQSQPINVFIENSAIPVTTRGGLISGLAAASSQNQTPPSLSLSSSPSNIPSSPQPPSATISKVIPTVFPLSLIQGLALNHAVTPVSTQVPQSHVSHVGGSNSQTQARAVPLLSAVSPILQPKIHPPEILIASPIKSGEASSQNANPANPITMAGRATALLAATTPTVNNNTAGILKTTPQVLVNTLPPVINSNTSTSSGTNSSRSSSTLAQVSLSATQFATAVSLPAENLKTLALTPTILPFTVAPGTLPANSTSLATPLRLLTPLTHGSVVTAPLTNGQTPLMPTVVQLDGSGQVAVLQNFLQLQTSPQVFGQPIVVVTTPSSVHTTLTSSVGQTDHMSYNSSSSGSTL